MAQSPACNAWRAELDSLRGQRGGDPRAAEAARRVGGAARPGQQPVSRAWAASAAASCSSASQPPPQCGGSCARQIGQLQAAVRRAVAAGPGRRRRAAPGAARGRDREQLPAQQRGFFETIFGIEPRRGEIDSTMPELDPDADRAGEAAPRRPAIRSACAAATASSSRSPTAPGGRDGADEMCQALCPGSEVTAFGMSNGGDIQNAVSRSTGQPYSSLPNAGKLPAQLRCRLHLQDAGPELGAGAAEAEQLLDKRKGDVIVTEQRAAELSRPSAPSAGPEEARRRAGRRSPRPRPNRRTRSRCPPRTRRRRARNRPASARNRSARRCSTQGDGLRRETRSVTGEKRTVRIVAPNLAPNLGPATTRQ